MAVETQGLDAVILRFRMLGPEAHRRLGAAVATEAIDLVGYIQEQKLSGQVLWQRTRRLRDSIHDEIEETAESIIATVGTDVKYAAIHEYGGFIPPHDILPKNAEALAFVIDGRQVFAKVVHHPGSQMPERSFLRSALRDRDAQIRAHLTAAVNGAIEGTTE